jgi:hypothetical protein
LELNIGQQAGVKGDLFIRTFNFCVGFKKIVNVHKAEWTTLYAIKPLREISAQSFRENFNCVKQLSATAIVLSACVNYSCSVY